MNNSVIAIGLDAADPDLVETWMSAGHLPNLRRLCKDGCYGRLVNSEQYCAETPWTTFLTGVMPARTGHWGLIKLTEGTYNVVEQSAYDFGEFPPFYALGDEYRVAVMDVPQTRLSDQVNGPQVLAWGAHSPQTESISRPAHLWQEINDRYGAHPALRRDHGAWWDKQYLSWLKEALLTGIERRRDICRDSLAREKWDLFLVAFGETHSAEHALWHLSQCDHPLYGRTAPASLFPDDPLLEVFKAADRAVGDLLEAAPADSRVIVFSTHGSQSNISDVAGTVLLPEFMYRFCFPSQQLMAGDKAGDTAPPLVIPGGSKSWPAEVWDRRAREHWLRRLFRNVTRFKQRGAANQRTRHRLATMEHLSKQGIHFPWMPTTWYHDLLPDMKAFALPTFSEGRIRINLKGREPSGIVAVDEYSDVCDEITGELIQLTNSRLGTRVVKQVMRTRQSGADRDPKLPDADLLVIWNDEPADMMDHPQYGRIGPVPYLRTGSHRAQGFFVASGPGIEPSSGIKQSAAVPTGHGVDLAATILTMMGAPVPDYMDSRLLLPIAGDTGVNNAAA